MHTNAPSAASHSVPGAPVGDGAEAQYADHSQQAIGAFGPHGDVTILNQFSVRAWYKTAFGGRKMLG